MLDRRTVMMSGGAVLALGGCLGPAGPGAVTISATGASGMNPGPDGSDRPLTLTIVQLRGAGAFDNADFFALQDPASALGGDLIKADQLVLSAGQSAQRVVGVEEGAAFIGVIAGFRQPGGKVFRAKVPAPASGDAGIVVSVGGGGISLQSA